MGFKVGEWIVCEFKIQIIKEKEKGHITEVSDGNFCHSSKSLDDCCFHLTLKTKRISDAVEYWSMRLHKEGNNSLNYPGIHNYLVERWCEACLAVEEEDDDGVEKALKDVEDFSNEILEKCKDLTYETVHGVRLVRPRSWGN